MTLLRYSPAWSPLALLLGALVLIAPGCRGRSEVRPDAEIAQHARAARTAYAEGEDADAIEEYRQALRRAWQIDDPVEIAHNAFNLAACLAAVGLYEEARDALAETRAELYRAGKSDADAWLLEAKIARSQGLFAEAATITESVAYLVPTVEGGAAPHGDRRARRHAERTDSCEKDAEPAPPPRAHPWMAKVRKHRHQGKHAEKRQAEAETAIAVHLLRANLACDEGDLDRASNELDEARRRLRHLSDPSPRAEIEQVAARILLLSGQPGAAAQRLDVEAELLRQAGHYRELPPALSSAGEAYLQSGDPVAAADRFHRVARILYARGELLGALHFIERSVGLAVMTGDFDQQARLALLFGEVDRAVQAIRQREARRARTRRPASETLPTPAPDDSPAREMPSDRQPAPQAPSEPWHDEALGDNPLLEFYPPYLPRPLPVIINGRLRRPPAGALPPAEHLPGGMGGFHSADAGNDRGGKPGAANPAPTDLGEGAAAIDRIRERLDRRLPLPLADASAPPGHAPKRLSR